MYIVYQYIIQNGEKIGFNCLNAPINKNEIKRQAEIRELIADRRVINASINDDGVIEVAGKPVIKDITLEGAPAQLATVSYSKKTLKDAKSLDQLPPVVDNTKEMVVEEKLLDAVEEPKELNEVIEEVTEASEPKVEQTAEVSEVVEEASTITEEAHEVENKPSEPQVDTEVASVKPESTPVESTQAKETTTVVGKKKSNKKKDTKTSKDAIKVSKKEKLASILSYIDDVRNKLCDGKVKSLAELKSVLNPDSTKESIINNGDFKLEDDDIIPIDMYAALYSPVDNDVIPVWTNLICYCIKYNTFIEISQMLDEFKVAVRDDIVLGVTGKQCDAGSSWAHDKSSAIVEMIYYAVSWVNFTNETHDAARKLLGNDFVESIISTIRWDVIKDKALELKHW